MNDRSVAYFSRAIGDWPAEMTPNDERTQRDAAPLYEQLERIVLPLCYRDRVGFIAVRRHAIALLKGSFFDTQRMTQQSVLKACFE